MKRRNLLFRVLTLALALGLVLVLAGSMLPVQGVYAAAAMAANQSEREEKGNGEKAEPEKGETGQEEEEVIREVIEIHDAEEFLAFADKCYIDAWSADKRVVLTEDIDLMDVDFDAVPVFAGIFDGQGHTISGFCYSGDGYVAGLFRYIEKEARVENLTLKGEVAASDEKECIGGLCGVNYGTIDKCSFQGTVSGRNTVGGLAGINEGTGVIRNSSAQGRVTGYYSTGGIVGKNYGEVTNCTNRSSINNDTEWVEEDDELGTGIFLSISLGDQGAELFSGVDTGGIAGYSDGMITGCINYGRIGYDHTGYNIGGIAGRQSGVVSSCTNRGEVYGRKDVGGIVGQLEPYIEIDEAMSLLHAVNRLHDLMEKTLDDMGEGKDALRVDLDSLISYSEGAVDAGDALAGQIADFVDDNMDQVQAMSDRIGHVMDMLPDVFDDVYDAEDSFSNINQELSVLADKLKGVGESTGAYEETDYDRLALLSTVGGNILSIQSYPAAGDTVRILVEPQKDYGLDDIRAMEADGSGIVLHAEADGNYTFTMPEANVRVEAYFSYRGEDASGAGESGTGKPEDEVPGAETAAGEKDSAGEEDSAGEDTGKEAGADGLPENGSGSGAGTDNGPGTSDGEAGTSGDGPAASGGETGTNGTAGSGAEAAEGGNGASENETGASASGTGSGADAGTTDSGIGSGTGNADAASNGSAGLSHNQEAEEAIGTGDEDLQGRTGDGTIEMPGKPGREEQGYELKHFMSGNIGSTGERKTMEERAGAHTQSAGGPVVKMSSNLSGNASCRVEGGKAALTVTPDGAYVVDGVAVTAADGQEVSASQTGENTYTFPANDGSTYQVHITFRKLDKQQAIDYAKEDIRSAIRRQQAAADKVNAIIKEIQGSSSVSRGQLEQLASALEETSSATAAVLSNLSVVSNVAGQQAADAMEAMGSSMGPVMENLQAAMDSIKSATRGARSMVDYVNGQPDIHFSKMGQAFDTNRENLHEQLKGMSGSLKSLSDNASGYSDVLNDDLRAVNDQINVIFNILTDNLTNYTTLSMEELYEDVDVDDMESITTGKAVNCRNAGVVKGDINIGGIAGAMSIDEEDPEDSAAGSVDYQIGRRYFTKCIITGCVNEGYVTAKKDGAGGIVGYMRHGITVDSEGYGSVESTEGNYVGGICGESLTVIKRCYALCSVSGGRNVGGIAGFADTLKDCYAMADCQALTGRKGAIAGQTVNYDDVLDEEEVKVSGNYYVGDNLYGIDNISYVGVAEPISYQELLTVENLPTQFRHLKVIYRIDDLYLGTQEVKFGEKLSCLEYPDIPEREGYYGVWPDYSEKRMMGNLLVKGEYKEEVTVLQSDGTYGHETEGGREIPYALVEQCFTEDTVLHVSISNKEPPEQAGNRENVIYDVMLENAAIGAEDTFAVRLYNPYGDAMVWGYEDGVWKELESKARGQYLQVSMTGPEQSFCIVEQGSRPWIWLAGGIGIVIMLVWKTLSWYHEDNRRSAAMDAWERSGLE